MRIADASYGSNEDGLIWGYRFVPGQPAQPISTDAVAEFLSAPADGDGGGFLWLHFSLSNTGSERYLRRALLMPDAFYDSLRSEVGSTRLELDDNALIAVVHDVLFDSSFDASEVGTTTLCIGPRLLVSARLRPLRSVDQLRAAVRSGQVFRSPVELLAHLLRDQASVLGEILRKRYDHGSHAVRDDKALFAYVVGLKDRYMRKAEPLNKVIYDNKLHVVSHALGTHTAISRVQGGKLKAAREIRIATLFRDAPAPFLEMIAVHELAHLKHREHDKGFYQLCAHMSPDYHQLEFDLRLYLTAQEIESAGAR